jgi:outer membrane protein
LVAKQNFQAAQEQLKSSRSYFNLVEKGFRQGVNSQIEFIDARNQLTQSELTVNLRQFEMLIAAAQLERETSSFIFN